MRVLHLFSNAKWTGPAEPALNLCLSLRKLGVDADFACPPLPEGVPHTMVETARDRGIEPILRFRMGKHRHPLRNLLDSMALGRYLQANRYDLLHCHLDNDHRIARWPAQSLGIPIIRSSYEGEGFRSPKRQRRLVFSAARILEPSQVALAHDLETFGYPERSMQVVPGAVDVERFDPAREVPDGRRWLGIPPDAFVIGIVARMQTHRRYEDFFRAIRMLVDAGKNAHAIVVGRGTNQETVGKQPVRELNLTDRVHFPGYVSGENYVGMLKAFSVKVFLVPGSDGTCRAVREAMAMGKPAIVANRGMLREIVDDGVNGFVYDGGPDSLYACLSSLCDDRAKEREMGRAARKCAIDRYSLDVQARQVLDIYETVLSERQTGLPG
ncbi:MAG: glycosyltransferase family 4 protein [Candidatus Hydrogenedentes bacterium]|nr:glycosyltransferase family 4 protein [Candidatus Hydrogenedentota bacterium]